jgi:tetrahydromethanopterin S-methyltransferase subunit G
MTSKKLLVPQSEEALEQMKAEIAQEFGVQLGADATARQNGMVGGMITKRLVQLAQEQLANHQ